jgi:transcriptional regulator with XRE-family HTH domain
MRLKNEIFLHVLDWLHKNKNVRDQAHLAAIMGISTNSMSRIMTGKNAPSEKTLRKLNEAFGNIFNMSYLRGQDPYHMLASDLAEDLHSTTFRADLGSASTSIAQRQDEKNLIDLASHLIVELEALRRQTTDELALLEQARQSFESATTELRKILATFSRQTRDYFPTIAAEDNEK